MHQESLWQQFRGLLKVKKFRIVLTVLAVLLVKELIFIASFNGEVSPIADGYSEANTIRGGTFFAEEGFTKYSGLPDLCYTEQHPEHGYKGEWERQGRHCDKAVYTHYPPGPEYLITPAIKACGVGNLYCIRLQPIAFNFLVSVLFVFVLFRFLGVEKGFWVALISILPPLFHNYWHGLHHQGYAFSFLLLQISLLLSLWTREKKHSAWAYLGLFTMGFIQGWLTFDYAFLASLTALPLYFLLKDKENVKLHHALAACFFSGIGFTISHILHFYQVVSFYGDFQTAFNDLFHAAKYRANNLGETSTRIPNLSELNPFSVLKDFLWRSAGRGQYLAINLINYVWIILALRFIKRIQFKKSGNTYGFDVRNSDLYAILAAILVSGGWALVMRQHAWIHSFINRHYYLVFLMCTIILFRGLTKEANPEHEE